MGIKEIKTTYLYDAFISYSHAVDNKLAPSLQTALHKLAKPWYKKRALHVFRDQTDLSATPHLWGNIENALRDSKYLVLMASPEAASSKWIKKEIEFWLKNKSKENILIALTEGEIIWDEKKRDFNWEKTNALPSALKGAYEMEPLYVDMRGFHSQEHLSYQNPEFKNKVVYLAATLHDKAVGDMIGEEVRQHKKTIRISWAAVMALLVLTLSSIIASYFAILQRQEAIAQRKVAEQRTAMLSADTAQKLIEEGDRDAALLLMMQATHPFTPQDMPDKIILGLEDAIKNAHKRRVLRLPPNSKVFTHAHRLLAQDATSGELIFISPTGMKESLGVFENTVIAASTNHGMGNYLIITSDYSLTEINPDTGRRTPIASFRPIGAIEDLSTLVRDGDRLSAIEEIDNGVYFTASQGGPAPNGDYGKYILVLDTNRNSAAASFFESDSIWMSRRSYLNHVETYADGTMTFMDLPQRAAFQISPDLSTLRPLEAIDELPLDFVPCKERGANPSFNKTGIRGEFFPEYTNVSGYIECPFSDDKFTIIRNSSSGSGGTFTWFDMYNELLADGPTDGVRVGANLRGSIEEFDQQINWIAPSPSGYKYMISHARTLIEENRRSAREIGRVAQIPEAGVYLSDDHFAVVQPDTDGIQIDLFSLSGRADEAYEWRGEGLGHSDLLHPDGCQYYFAVTELIEGTLRVIEGEVDVYVEPLEGALDFALLGRDGEMRNTQRITLDHTRCYRFSPDHELLMMYNFDGVLILQFGDFLRGIGPIEPLQYVETGYVASAYFLPGSGFDFLTTNGTPVVYRWTYNKEQNAFLRGIYYQGERDIFGAEPDLHARRMILTEHLGARNFGTFLYSIEADRIVRPLASDYKFAYLASFLKDGRIIFGFSSSLASLRPREDDRPVLILDPPDVQKLYREAMSLLSIDCLPTREDDLSSSPCWYTGLKD